MRGRDIDIIPDSEARAIRAMEDTVQLIDGPLHGYGHYHETYRKVEGQWLIASMHLTLIRVSQHYISDGDTKEGIRRCNVRLG